VGKTAELLEECGEDGRGTCGVWGRRQSYWRSVGKTAELLKALEGVQRGLEGCNFFTKMVWNLLFFTHTVWLTDKSQKVE
jgi:hypothetical protein